MQYLFAAALALGGLAAVASPAIVSLSRARYSPAQVAGARRMLWSSAFVVTVATCHVAGISLASHAVNVIVEALAVVFGLGLAGFSFLLRPRAVGIVAGLCALLAWLMLMLFVSLGTMYGGGGARSEVRLPDGSVCQASGFGNVGSGSDVDVSVFRRFLVFDKLIAAHRYSVEDPDDLAYPDQAVLRQCLAALSADKVPVHGI